MAVLEHGARYRIVNVKSGTSLHLSDSNSPYAWGWASNSSSNQIWEAEHWMHGLWRLKNMASNKYLAIESFSQPRDGLKIVGSHTDFNWRIVPDDQDASVLRIFLPDTVFNIDLSGYGDMENGTSVELWGRWHGKNQCWRFQKHSPKPVPKPVPKLLPKLSITRGRFYHETVALEVNGAVYRVCRYGFEKWSPSVFRDMFAPPKAGSQRKGDSDEDPIKLNGCTNEEFESLLEVMYPLTLIGPAELTKEKWIGVLKLSRLWEMPEIAALAIKSLDECKLTAIEKITLGQAHGVSTWLDEGNAAIANDLNQTSLEDIGKLGWEAAARLLWSYKFGPPKKDTAPEDTSDKKSLQLLKEQRKDAERRKGLAVTTDALEI